VVVCIGAEIPDISAVWLGSTSICASPGCIPGTPMAEALPGLAVRRAVTSTPKPRGASSVGNPTSVNVDVAN
jgi:hypothetical protein